MELLNDFLSWVWARHHNELSWYVRPLFLLPFCFFAYRRSVWGIVATLLLFPTSLFWFPAPENPSPRVEGYLAWERQFLLEGSVVARVALVLLVVTFFVALAVAFWRRSCDQRGHAAQGDLERRFRGSNRLGVASAVHLYPGCHRCGHPAGDALLEASQEAPRGRETVL